MGRRTQNASGTFYVYDGNNAVQEISGGTVTANLLTGLRVDETFTRTDGSGERDFLAGTVGSTLALTDASGTVQTQYSFDPFGATTASGATSGNGFQFTGRENDGTGLYYYRARYYNPALGRFISEDPVFPYGGVNSYAYALDNPMMFSDPSGLSAGTAGEAALDLMGGVLKVGGALALAPETGGLSLLLLGYSGVTGSLSIVAGGLS